MYKKVIGVPAISILSLPEKLMDLACLIFFNLLFVFAL